MTKVISIVLGGGKGTRLYPLTKERAKPAVPFGGKYRLVDIPISNCINSGFKQIYILTQFNSVSLHNHLANTYIFDVFSRGFVEILAAEQTFENASWYQGTADAVRQNFMHFHTQEPSHYFILSGDQLYRMDLRAMFNEHQESKCNITVASTLVSRQEANELGILRVDKNGIIEEFLEKPGPDMNIDNFKLPADLHPNPKLRAMGKEYLASMGMYIFNAKKMEESLDNEFTDFGKEIIPKMVGKEPVNTYIFDGFWEDIGTISNFYTANLMLTHMSPSFNFYDENMPIYTHRRHLPATKINYCNISQSLAAEGSIITNATIHNSIVGVRSTIESGANLDGAICMGANWYEDEEHRQENKALGRPNIGIGSGTMIRKAIIDQNARIGAECRIGADPIAREEGDFDNYYIKDGIIVIPKGAIIPDGTII
jgi:glucose-1-phosphate adenylyltransferase